MKATEKVTAKLSYLVSCHKNCSASEVFLRFSLPSFLPLLKQRHGNVGFLKKSLSFFKEATLVNFQHALSEEIIRKLDLDIPHCIWF